MKQNRTTDGKRIEYTNEEDVQEAQRWLKIIGEFRDSMKDIRYVGWLSYDWDSIDAALCRTSQNVNHFINGDTDKIK